MLNSKDINKIVSGIVTEFSPNIVILFGSYATNQENENSDIDLLIVQETPLAKQYRSIPIRKSLLKSKSPIDILVYTPTEFEAEKLNKYSFVFQTMKTSKILYEQS